MAVIKVDTQMYSNGSKPLDAKLEPVESLEDLYKIKLTDRYNGMIVTVLNSVYEYDEQEGDYVLVSSNPIEYQLVGGITNDKWTEKKTGSANIKITGDDI